MPAIPKVRSSLLRGAAGRSPWLLFRLLLRPAANSLGRRLAANSGQVVAEFQADSSRKDSPVRILYGQGGSRLRVAAAGCVSPSIARRAGSAAAMAAFARSRRRKGPRAAPSQCDRSLCNLILYPFPNSGTAAGLRRSRRDTQDGARSSASSPTSRPASPRERRPRARPRSSLATRRATRRG
jgi:hypothetical protein